MRWVWSIALVAMLWVLCAEELHATPALPGNIEVTMTGFRSDRGRAMVALWRSAQGFPGKPPSDAPTCSVAIENGRASAQFENMPAGNFAITVFHDEDGDTELKENLLGIPKEGVGFSRDVRPRFSAPRFDEAKLVLVPGALKRVPIKILYL